MDLKGIIFIATHPSLAARTAIRQREVGINLSGPPKDVAIEEFSEAPLDEAMRMMRNAELQELAQNKGGVPENAWPSKAQKMMARGEAPIGHHPEHPNI
jgi:hypothetical protein